MKTKVRTGDGRTIEWNYDTKVIESARPSANLLTVVEEYMVTINRYSRQFFYMKSCGYGIKRHLHERKEETSYDGTEVDVDCFVITICTVSFITNLTCGKVQNGCDEEEHGGTQNVRPDIHRLIVDLKGALQGAEVRKCCSPNCCQ